MSGDDETPKRGLLGTFRANAFPSRQPPKITTTQTAHVLERKYGGNRQAMAAAYGVTPTAVGRWLKGTRTPRGRDAENLRHDAAEVQTTERGRERRAREVERAATGSNASVSRTATFAIRGSDAIRAQDVPLRLSAAQIAALVRAQDEETARRIVGSAIADYFNSGAYARWTAEDFDYDPESFTLG
ncbi:hypothetical protein ACFV9E_14930 [Streptomyces sp. NPDC059835]|uniref:hypothetical protein n=1 Tax=Streptomyces sp. NPDC059835 TaxID=3346967 RepID=UPI003657A1CD